MKQKGFTIVELVITVAVMGILLTLAVVNVTSTQVNARDTERKGDVETIASAMETYYNTKQDGVLMSGGTYPGTTYLASPTFKQVLPDLDSKAVYAPGVDDTGAMSLIAATNATQTTAGVTPQPTFSTYVFQPLTQTGTLCTNPATAECRKFNIFYRLEGDNAVKVLTSKIQ